MKKLKLSVACVLTFMLVLTCAPYSFAEKSAASEKSSMYQTEIPVGTSDSSNGKLRTAAASVNLVRLSTGGGLSN